VLELSLEEWLVSTWFKTISPGKFWIVWSSKNKALHFVPSKKYQKMTSKHKLGEFQETFRGLFLVKSRYDFGGQREQDCANADWKIRFFWFKWVFAWKSQRLLVRILPKYPKNSQNARYKISGSTENTASYNPQFFPCPLETSRFDPNHQSNSWVFPPSMILNESLNPMIVRFLYSD